MAVGVGGLGIGGGAGGWGSDGGGAEFFEGEALGEAFHDGDAEAEFVGGGVRDEAVGFVDADEEGAFLELVFGEHGWILVAGYWKLDGGLLGGLDGSADGGFGDGAQGLGRIVLITAQLHPARAVRARLQSECGNTGLRAEGAAGEALPAGAGVGKERATAQHQEQGRGNYEARSHRKRRLKV